VLLLLWTFRYMRELGNTVIAFRVVSAPRISDSTQYPADADRLKLEQSHA
jgi:hypothetical protein